MSKVLNMEKLKTKLPTIFLCASIVLVVVVSMVGAMLILAPLFFCVAIDQDESQHAEKERLRVRDVSSRYDFGPSRRYVFVDRIGEESYCYDLYDTRTRQLLIEQVVKWDEKGGELIFSTKSGKRCALSYDKGKVSEMAREK